VANETVDTPSAAYNRMVDGWRTIDDILAGPDTIRLAGERYLPAYQAEKRGSGLVPSMYGESEYSRRLKATPWRPEFPDIIQALASKPFTKEVSLVGEPPSQIKALKEDIDARGNDLTAFSRSVFKGGIAKGVHGILVDFPTMAPNLTRADEKASGARPYWVSIRAEDIIALYTSFVGGREIVQHVRLKECAVERLGFGEIKVERVRVLEPGRWELWEKRGDAQGYTLTGSGTLTLKEVPLALFWTGEREGSHFVRPPLAALADMQIELYRALGRQEEILTYAGSPMLQAQGIAAPADGESLEVGPKRVLFAPPGADGAQTGWSYIQPDAAVLTEIREGVEKVAADMRRLGMQPLTQKSGDVTATATSVEAAKAHSTVEAWAIGLKDVLEQAFTYTSNWLNQTETVEISVNTDFMAGAPDQASLDALHKARAAKEISRRAYLEGLIRFGVLVADFDIEADEELVAEEMEGLEPEQPIDPAIDPERMAAE
jgi:hypothetical protein